MDCFVAALLAMTNFEKIVIASVAMQSLEESLVSARTP